MSLYNTIPSVVPIYDAAENLNPPRPPTNFSPYAVNGGSLVGIAGKDFSVIGSDTRLCIDFAIYSRSQSKLIKLSDTCILGMAGCWCDAITLFKVVKARMDIYKHENSKAMNTPAVASMLSTILYYKRFFPYYVASVIAGLDEKGEGCVYSFDPMGHYLRTPYTASGTSACIMQSFLDSQVGNGKITENNPEPINISQKKAVSILKDAFNSATERHIFTGDNIHIMLITNNGIKEEKYCLRKD